MAPTSSLAIPPDTPSASTSRPASVNTYSAAPPPSTSRRQRASHQVVSSNQQQQEDSQHAPYTDVYSHPAAVAYATAHPRRTIPKFGPYLLLQTLGEGEFGKVKLGLHSQWGEEVAVKLIRRGSIDNSVRMSKVEREIEVLRTLKHPNIVRLYDVIETDKYIGIIIEYASGGELFDHILAHRFLREKDAAKLFSQLISGVWYIHQKKIVHRDLKLENLLLDRHRNVIITDFGFANRFEHRTDDLMQTSCGSPCYAAPELVISEGSYVGSAVDIWSCGVILYAMLAGYLPFDDDPANPDGDNINLLYKYIVNTPLSFPDYVSQGARDLLGIMLVPDPKGRATLEEVMRHKWLEAYWIAPFDPSAPTAFGRTVDELENVALEQHQQKRLAYQRTMRATVRENVVAAAVPPPATKSRTQPTEYLYETAPTERSTHGFDDDPFAAPSSVVAQQQPISAPALADKPGRHTIQVEYDSAPRSASKRDRVDRESATPITNGREKRHHKESSIAPLQASDFDMIPMSSSPSQLDSPPAVPVKSQDTPTSSPAKGSKAAPRVSQPSAQGSMHIDVPPPSITVASPPVTPQPDLNGKHQRTASAALPSAQTVPSSLGSGPTSTPSKAQQALQNAADSSMLSNLGSPTAEQTPAKEGPKKSRRNTLTVMVEPISRTIRGRSKNSSRSSATVAPTSASDAEKPIPVPSPAPPSREASEGYSDARGREHADRASTTKAKSVMQWFRSRSKGPRDSSGVTATPSQGVQGYDTGVEQEPHDGRTTPTQESHPSASNGRVTPTQEKYDKNNRSSATIDKQNLAPQTPVRASSTSSVTPSFVSRFRNSLTVGGASREGRSEGRPRQVKTEDTPVKVSTGGGLRIHHGAVDQNMVTTLPPVQVMRHIREVLLDMGIEVQLESEFKYRCIRAKRKRMPGSDGKASADRSGGSMAAFNLVGSAGSNGVDKRGLPVPSSSFTGGNMLRGLLMRRQSSQTGNASLSEDSPDTSVVDVATNDSGEPVYGDQTEDVGDEVRFSVELTRMDRLTDTFSLDIRRLKGNLRSYKFLYDTIRDRSTLKQ